MTYFNDSYSSAVTTARKTTQYRKSLSLKSFPNNTFYSE